MPIRALLFPVVPVSLISVEKNVRKLDGAWEGCEGKKASVTVYSDADKIELLVNGKSAGKKKPKKDIAKFRKIPYEAGKIEAIAYDSSGKETARTTLVSATGKTSIKLTPETTNLCANGQDLCFLNIDLIGENGITKSSVDQELKIEISGPATLQGYGSARPNVEESFCNDTFKTFYGKSLAVIRAGYEPGTVTVKVSGKGLDTQELRFLNKTKGEHQNSFSVLTFSLLVIYPIF